MTRAEKSFDREIGIDASGCSAEGFVDDSSSIANDVNTTKNGSEPSFTDFDYDLTGDPANYCVPEDERFPD